MKLYNWLDRAQIVCLPHSCLRLIVVDVVRAEKGWTETVVKRRILPSIMMDYLPKQIGFGFV